MTKQKAQEEGLHFTGFYSHDKVEIKAWMEKMRGQHPKARFIRVTVPQNPLARGYHGTGYSVYVDDINVINAMNLRCY